MPIEFPFKTAEILVKFPLTELEIRWVFYAKNKRNEGNSTPTPIKTIQTLWDKYLLLFPKALKVKAQENATYIVNSPATFDIMTEHNRNDISLEFVQQSCCW